MEPEMINVRLAAVDDETWQKSHWRYDISGIVTRVNELLELGSPSYKITSDSFKKHYINCYWTLEIALVLMLRYFDIEISRHSSTHGEHRFHQALLDELQKPQCPLYEMLGQEAVHHFLRDFKNFRNYYESEYDEKLEEFKSRLERLALKLDFRTRWSKVEWALCDIVKCIKMEAAQRCRRETSWAKVRDYESSLALRRERLCVERKEGEELTRELAIGSKIQEESTCLQELWILPTAFSALITRYTENEIWFATKKVEAARAIESLQRQIKAMAKEKEDAAKALAERCASILTLLDQVRALTKEMKDGANAIKEKDSEIEVLPKKMDTMAMNLTEGKLEFATKSMSRPMKL